MKNEYSELEILFLVLFFVALVDTNLSLKKNPI